MKATRAIHPSPEDLAAFLLGRLDPARRAVVERHVSECQACCDSLRQVPDDTLLERIRNVQTRGDTQAVAADNGVPPELTDHPRYRLVKRLGEGGMGVVYLAEHRIMERTVALKVINRSLTSNKIAVERFRQEVKAAARLNHPNIVTAFDAEQAGDLHFLVMEFVDGTSLASIVEKRGPLAVNQACGCIRQAALGLQHAHEQGMVHRDIKPHNLMLTKKGHVKVLDFGLARLVDEQPGGRRVTSVGTVVGTPDYISPEQASDSRKADIRSDIYSLGCTLYFLLAGHPPYPGGSAMDKLLSHVENAPVPLNSKRGDVPEGLPRVLAKMMAKDPATRYQTPGEVAEALAPFFRGTQPVPMEAKPASRRRKQPRPERARNFLPLLMGGAILGAIVAGVLLLCMFWQRPGGQGRASPTASSSKPRVLLMLTQRGFWSKDYWPVRDVLTKGAAEVIVGSTALTSCEPAVGGPRVTPQVALGDIKAVDYDAIVFLGTTNVGDFVSHKPQLKLLIRETLDAPERKYVGGLCMGMAVLAAVDELKGKRAASPTVPEAEKLRSWAGAVWIDEPVVLDGQIITGGSDRDAVAFAERLLAVLRERK